MLFDERPKESGEELFDREREIEEIKKAVGPPLVILTSAGRIGKTSSLEDRYDTNAN